MPRRWPDDVDAGQANAVGHVNPLLLLQFGRARLGVYNLGTGGNGAEILLDQAIGLRRVEVAGDAQAGVGRMIVAAEEVGDVLARGLGDVFHRADRRPAIGMIGRIKRGQDRFVDQAIGAVLVALATLVLDHVPLVVEFRLGHGREQKAHAVRFHPEGQFEVIRRHGLPIVRAVHGGRAVQPPAHRLDRPKVDLIEVLRALEHHVFEEVGEPGPARPLVLGTDVIPDVDADNGRRVVFVQDDLETIGERELLEFQFRNLWHGRCGGSEES